MKAFKIIILILMPFVFSVSQVWALDREREVIGQLRSDIALLNLLNGLNLTDEQMKELLKLAREADAIKDGLKGDAPLREFEDALTKLKEGLMDRDSRPSPQIEEKAAMLNQRLKVMRDEGTDELRILEERVKRILTPGQLVPIVRGLLSRGRGLRPLIYG